MPSTDEDIIRDLMHCCADHLSPPASIATGVATRQRRRDRRVRVASLTAAGAALGTAAGVIALAPGQAARLAHGAPPVRPAIRLTAEQRELYRLSSVAASQPPGHGRYVVMSTEGSGVKDTSVIDSRTGSMWSYQKGTGGSPSGRGFTRHYSPTAARLAAMPTGLAALRAALISQWDAQLNPVPSPRRGPVPVPRRIRRSADDKVFQQASYLLWNPLVGPSLRSALYKVLAAVPGVTVSSSARDGIGRPAVEISRTDNSGYAGDRSDRAIYATYESPATGAVLESTVTYPPGSGVVSPQDPHGTSAVVETDIYLSITRSSVVPGDPYGG